MEVHVMAMDRAKEDYNELTGAKHNRLDLLLYGRVRNTERHKGQLHIAYKNKQ